MLVVFAGAVLVLVTLAAAGTALSAGIRHRLQGLADAAALAAATSLGDGGDACATARTVVAAAAGWRPLHPVLAGCSPEADGVDVTVVTAWRPGVAARLLGPSAIEVSARSRAAVARQGGL